MDIVFICGSLEPGRDGVGDYTRRLVTELIGTGNKAGIISLNDKHVSDEFSGVQQSGDIKIAVLRIPSAWPSGRRFERAQLWIGDFNPRWLSIQFVPFSFHSKGLFFGQGRLLAKLGKGRFWHVMVHELWVGMDKEASLKFALWGRLQRTLIKSLLTKLKPLMIHTQSGLYKIMLEKIGFKSVILPLFGNIPLIANNQMQKSQVRGTISFILFGGIHPGAPVKEFFNDLKNYSTSTKTKVLVRMVGRCGKEQFLWEKESKEAGLAIEILGEKSPEDISEVLLNSSFGVSTTPFFLIEKSGSVAAMREHGLTVLCVSREWNPRGIKKFELPAGVSKYEAGEIGEFIQDNFKSSGSYNIGDIANQFVNNLLATI
ncbi:MAG: hypothetical protein ABI691_16435 [Ginsengibacter sp.]